MREAQDRPARRLQVVRAGAIALESVTGLVGIPAIELDRQARRRPDGIHFHGLSPSVGGRPRKTVGVEKREESILQPRSRHGGADGRQLRQCTLDPLVAATVPTACTSQDRFDLPHVEAMRALSLLQRLAEPLGATTPARSTSVRATVVIDRPSTVGDVRTFQPRPVQDHTANAPLVGRRQLDARARRRQERMQRRRLAMAQRRPASGREQGRDPVAVPGQPSMTDRVDARMERQQAFAL